MSYIPYYNRVFPPIVKEFEHIAVPKDPSYRNLRFYRVLAIHAIPRLNVPLVPRDDPSVSSIASGEEKRIEDPRELRIADNEVLQLRIAWIDFPVELSIALGAARQWIWNYRQRYLYLGIGGVVENKLPFNEVEIPTTDTVLAVAPNGYSIYLAELEVTNTNASQATVYVKKYDESSGNWVIAKRLTIAPNDTVHLENVVSSLTDTRLALVASTTGIYASGLIGFKPSVEKEYATEFYIAPDIEVVLYVKNVLSSTIPITGVKKSVNMYLYGYRYQVEEVPSAPEKYTVLPVLPITPVTT